MRVLVFALYLTSLGAFAKHYKVSGNLLEFKKDDSGLLVYGCDKGCEALKVLTISKYDPSTIKRKSQFVASLGSEACHYILGGKTYLGVNMDKDGRDFCVFKDQSMLEINSLSDYLKKHKIK